MTTTARTFDWDHIATLTGPALDAALASVTGIRCEPTATRRATGEVRDRDGRGREVDADADTLALLAESGHRTARPDRTTLAGIVRDAAHTVPDVRTALVLSAAMHADVVSASGRVVVTRLARHLTGDDDRATVRAVGDALTDALLHIADALADATAERDADVRTVPHRAVRVVGRDDDGRALASLVVVGSHRVVRDAGSDADRAPSLCVPATRRERSELVPPHGRDGHAPGDLRGYVRPGMTRPVLACPVLGYPYALGYTPVMRHEGPTLPAARGTRLPAPWHGAGATARVASHMVRATGPLGTGYTLTPGTPDRVRDALGRVSLASGATVAPERLAGPLTRGALAGKGWTASASDGGPRRAPGERTERAARAAARERLAALRVTRRK